MLVRLLMLVGVLYGVNVAARDDVCTMHLQWLIYTDVPKNYWLTEQHCADTKRWVIATRQHNIIARLPVPALPAGSRFNYGQCELNGALRNDVIAIVRHNKEIEWSSDVSHAWLVDPLAKAIKPIPTTGLSCRYEGYGK
jgi:hypothetical protein